MRRSAVLIVNTAGSSRGLTSSHSSGIDTGALGLHRTENGGTIVWPDALRMTSRYTGARRFALRGSTVTSLGLVGQLARDREGVRADVFLFGAAPERDEDVQPAAPRRFHV